ncbi:MAG: radical SAM protein [Candidatus Fermentibacter sp.]|nr:radical SAM protein [Candidatus Fermentibacter sp.]
MRICLLQPPRPGGRGTNLLPPLGLLYLASSLEKAGHEVALVDAALLGLSGEGLLRAVSGREPDILMVSAFTSDVSSLACEMPRLREGLPAGTAMWLGGPHASCRGKASLDDLPWFDAAFVGEAEETAVEAVSAFPAEPDITGVIRRSAPRETAPASIADLSALPLPAWHLAPPGRYRGLPNGVVLRRSPYAPILTTRGCPYHCTFCAGFRVTGRSLRHRPLRMVWDEIELLRTRFGVREIHIEDDNFTFDRDYAMAFCEEAAARNTGLLFSTPNGVRLDRLDPGLLSAMKRAGWYVIHCGIESGSDRILAGVRKATDTASIRSAVRMIRDAGLPAAGYFILGLPGETRQEMLQTISFAKDIGLAWAHFAAFLPIPGSEAGDSYLAAHGIPGGSWSTFHNTACPAPPDGISRSGLKAIQRRAFMSFYMRPRPFFRAVALLFRGRHAARLARRALEYLSPRAAADARCAG